MKYWERHGGRVVGTFSERQIRWFRERLLAFRDLLDIAHAWLTVVDPDGLRPPALSDIDPVAYRSLAQIVVRRAEQHTDLTDRPDQVIELLNQTRGCVHKALATLPATTGLVVIYGPRTAWAWIWALYECAMSVYCELDLDWSAADPNVKAVRRTRSWLLRVVDELIETADLPTPATVG